MASTAAGELQGTFEMSMPGVWTEGKRPKSNGVYLVTRDIGVPRVDVLCFYGNRWTRTKHRDDRTHIKGVVAWMPLPEPFVPDQG